jgi:hypothetical protein
MSGAKVVTNARPRLKRDVPAKRERSTIEFPYGDLGDALTVVRAIHSNAGTSCTTDQLAAYMKQTSTSGAFRTKTATASIFGVTNNERGAVTLTDLGRRIVDPSQARQATADAFLTVPLYKAIYEKFKGHTLPPAPALQREMAALGVAAKSTEKARQAFDRSAEEAGFFAHGKERLVVPSGVSQRDATKTSSARETSKHETTLQRSGNDGGASGGGGASDHPFIQGLLQKLPAPETQWDDEGRAAWIEAAVKIFDLMYKGGEGRVSVQINKKIAG